MRIAVPTESEGGSKSLASTHFGRCKTFTVFDEKGRFIEVIDNSSEHQGGMGKPPELMRQNNIDLLLCKGLGPSAISMCEGFGINVFLAQGRTAEDMVRFWQDDKAKQASEEDGCKDHRH